MTTRIGAKGQVVIRKAVRDRAGLQPGVDIDLDGDTVIMTAVRREWKLAGRFADSGMAQRLLEDRAAEPR